MNVSIVAPLAIAAAGAVVTGTVAGGVRPNDGAQLCSMSILGALGSAWATSVAVGPASRGDTPRLPAVRHPGALRDRRPDGGLRVLSTGPADLEVDGFERLVDTFDLMKQISNTLLDPPPDTIYGDGIDGDGTGGLGPAMVEPVEAEVLGSDQAKAIQSSLIEKVPVDEIEARRIRIGSPYEFQGDERDVIIISMVDATTPERRVSGRAATDASQ